MKDSRHSWSLNEGFKATWSLSEGFKAHLES